MKRYRKNAGIVVFNRDKKVLMCERIDGDANMSWQFPQGGMEQGETPEAAARRELMEETSITSVRLIAQIKEGLKYDFPPEIKERFARRGINTDGQEQYWSLFLFEGQESEINLRTAEPEFKNWRWNNIKIADKQVIAFKQEIYRRVIKEFAPIIEKFE